MMKSNLRSIALRLVVLAPVLMAAECPETSGEAGVTHKENGDTDIHVEAKDKASGVGFEGDYNGTTGETSGKLTWGDRDSILTGSLDCEGGEEQGEFLDGLEVDDSIGYDYEPYEDGSGCGTLTLTDEDGGTTEMECCESGSDDADRYDDDDDDDDRVDAYRSESASSSMDW